MIERERERERERDRLTIQQLQHQKLSISLLDMDQLNELYAHLQSAANKNNYKLLIQSPQDLFQLDVSYIRKGADVLIFPNKIEFFYHKEINLQSLFEFCHFELILTLQRLNFFRVKKI